MKRRRKTQHHDYQPLPREIMFDIFSRLPISDLSHCMFVCKHWFNTIKDPVFVNLHPSCLLLLGHTHTHHTTTKPPCFLIFNSSDKESLCMVDHENNLPTSFKLLHSTRDLNIPSSLLIEIVGSCNGLLCLKLIYDPGSFYICNPITRETLKLPKAPVLYAYRAKTNPTHHYLMTTSCEAGFAFDAVTHTYKVFCVWYRYLDIVVDIFNLCSRRWRRVKNKASVLSSNQVSVNVNGALHWLMGRYYGIYAIDITTEKDTLFQMPPGTGERNLMSLRESLCVAHHTSLGIELWIMKDYGVESSWTKEYMIRRQTLGLLKMLRFETLSTAKKGSVLLLGVEHQGYYDLEKQLFEPIMIDEIQKRLRQPLKLNAVVHFGSLISPKALLSPSH